VWHVSSRSGVATLRTAIHLLLTYLPTTFVVSRRGRRREKNVQRENMVSNCNYIRLANASASVSRITCTFSTQGCTPVCRPVRMKSILYQSTKQDTNQHTKIGIVLSALKEDPRLPPCNIQENDVNCRMKYNKRIRR